MTPQTQSIHLHIKVPTCMAVTVSFTRGGGPLQVTARVAAPVAASPSEAPNAKPDPSRLSAHDWLESRLRKWKAIPAGGNAR